MTRNALPRIYLLRHTIWLDTQGKRCKCGVSGARKVRSKSAYWYADVRPIETIAERRERQKAGLPCPPRRRIRLLRNKSAAQEMLKGYVDKLEQEAAGLKDYSQLANQPLGSVLDEFKSYLASKNNDPEYVETTIARIEKTLHGASCLTIRDLDSDKAAAWLHRQRTNPDSEKSKVKGTAKNYADIAAAFDVSVSTVTYWRQRGAPIIRRRQNDLAAIAKWKTETQKPDAMSFATSNHYVTAMRSFGRWLAKAKYVQTNPFEDLPKLDAEPDRRKTRRAMSDEEFSQLLHATRSSGRVFRGLDGNDRSMIYLIAAYTGLRASEIGSLTPKSFDFTGKVPTVSVSAAYTKNDKTACQPLQHDLVAEIKLYLGNRIQQSLSIDRVEPLIWPGTWTDVGADMIRIDLSAAGIIYKDDRGRDFDFHALRHQFITGLARANVHPKTAQHLARHSRIELTMGAYTHLELHDVAAEVEKLPSIPKREQKQVG